MLPSPFSPTTCGKACDQDALFDTDDAGDVEDDIEEPTMITMLLVETGRMMTINKLMLLMVLLLLVILTKAIFFANLLQHCLRRCRLDRIWSLEQARVQWDGGKEGHQIVVAHLGV